MATGSRRQATIDVEFEALLRKASVRTSDYKYVKPAGDGKWKIVQKGTGKTLSVHDSQEEAEAAFRAMEMHMHGGSRKSADIIPGGSQTGAPERPDPSVTERQVECDCGNWVGVSSVGPDGAEQRYGPVTCDCGVTFEVEPQEVTARRRKRAYEEGPWYCATCNGQIAGGPETGWSHLGPAEQGHGSAADADHQATPRKQANVRRQAAENYDDPIELEPEDIPSDFPVRPLRPGDNPPGKTTCGTCGLSWDDDITTSMTPTPSARCPFEYFHQYGEDSERNASKRRRNSVNKNRQAGSKGPVDGNSTVPDSDKARNKEVVDSQRADFADQIDRDLLQPGDEDKTLSDNGIRFDSKESSRRIMARVIPQGRKVVGSKVILKAPGKKPHVGKVLSVGNTKFRVAWNDGEVSVENKADYNLLSR